MAQSYGLYRQPDEIDMTTDSLVVVAHKIVRQWGTLPIAEINDHRNEFLLAQEVIRLHSEPKREISRDAEVARIAGVIDRFWQLHSIEPATGFTPEQLAKEILR
jgi:hypothetical protein